MSGKDPAPGIEENVGSTIFQPMPFPRPGVAACRFDRRPEPAARTARRLSAGHNGALVLACWMQEAFGILRGTRGGPAHYHYALPWYVLIGLTPTHGGATGFAPARSPPGVIEESGVWSLCRLPDAARATFSIGRRNLRYRFQSSAGPRSLDMARLSRFRCLGGA